MRARVDGLIRHGSSKIEGFFTVGEGEVGDETGAEALRAEGASV
jgi:hypothetical protein